MGGGTDKKWRFPVGLPLIVTSLDKAIVPDTVSDTRVMKDWNGKTSVEDREGELLRLPEGKRMWRLSVRCDALRDVKLRLEWRSRRCYLTSVLVIPVGVQSLDLL